jgi:hypothetical protein
LTNGIGTFVVLQQFGIGTFVAEQQQWYCSVWRVYLQQWLQKQKVSD